MQIIRPLTGSVDAPDHRQPWRTGGLWQRTINLYVEGGALLTLHRHGQGISPGGWVLRHRDFIRLHGALRAGALPAAGENGIQVDDLCCRRRADAAPCGLAISPLALAYRKRWWIARKRPGCSGRCRRRFIHHCILNCGNYATVLPQRCAGTPLTGGCGWARGRA